MGETLPKVFVRRDDALQITDDFAAAWQAYPDLDQATARKALSRFALQSLRAFLVRSTAPDRTHAITYVIATRSQMPRRHMVQLSAADQLAATLGRI